jgi:hypothetical protein
VAGTLEDGEWKGVVIELSGADGFAKLIYNGAEWSDEVVAVDGQRADTHTYAVWLHGAQAAYYVDVQLLGTLGETVAERSPRPPFSFSFTFWLRAGDAPVNPATLPIVAVLDYVAHYALQGCPWPADEMVERLQRNVAIRLSEIALR